MLLRYFVLCFIVFSSSCRSSDVIPCPEVKALKLKEANYRYVRIKKEDVNASAKKGKRYRDPYLFTRAETLADKMDVEEWDCPKPGTRRKVIRENKKRMEKRVQSMVKKRSGADHQNNSPSTNASGN